jgi:hypothetical protein
VQLAPLCDALGVDVPSHEGGAELVARLSTPRGEVAL